MVKRGTTRWPAKVSSNGTRRGPPGPSPGCPRRRRTGWRPEPRPHPPPGRAARCPSRPVSGRGGRRAPSGCRDSSASGPYSRGTVRACSFAASAAAAVTACGAGSHHHLAQSAGQGPDADGGEAGGQQHGAQHRGGRQVGHRLGQGSGSLLVREGRTERGDGLGEPEVVAGAPERCGGVSTSSTARRPPGRRTRADSDSVSARSVKLRKA